MMTKQDLRKMAIVLAAADDLLKLLEKQTASDFTRGRTRSCRRNIAALIDTITNSVRATKPRRRATGIVLRHHPLHQG